MTQARKKTTDRNRKNASTGDANFLNTNFNLGGFLGKFGELVEKLGDLAEKGKEFSRTGELRGLDPEGKLRGVYGVTVKMGLGEQGDRELRVEPFGNIHRKASGETVVEEAREPLVEVYEEEDHLLVVAEIPGVSQEQVQLELSENKLTIDAQRGEHHYHKQLTLPAVCSREKMQWDCKNGMLSVRFQR